MNEVFSATLQSGANAAAENLGGRALDFLTGLWKKKNAEQAVLTRTAFDHYLGNAMERYNHVKTLATGLHPQTVTGKGSIYVKNDLSYYEVTERRDCGSDGETFVKRDIEERTVSTESITSILNELGNCILIQGPAGAGKTMLMRYLFVKTAQSGEFVPIFLELRNIPANNPIEISITKLIQKSLSSFDVAFTNDTLWEEFRDSLNYGKYLFLMDGFDEIPDSIAAESAKAIQQFCAAYSSNPCIVTTRPKARTEPLQTFRLARILPLTVDKAVELSSNLWYADRQTREFERQLRTLYNDGRYHSFATNPLLLSLMFLTFMRNHDLPNHSSELFEKSYEALYSLHDASKGAFNRELLCKDLDEAQFKTLLARFCFQSYHRCIFEFEREDILSMFLDCAHYMRLKEFSPKDYLIDLQRNVCLIIFDGFYYRFIHQSFQVYLAAWYTNKLTDERQKLLFHTLLSGETYWNKSDYWDILFQMNTLRIGQNALEEGLRQLQEECLGAEDNDVQFLKSCYEGFALRFYDPQTGMYHETREAGDTKIVSFIVRTNNPRYFNLSTLFRRHYNTIWRDIAEDYRVNAEQAEVVSSLLEKIKANRMQLDEICTLSNFTEDDRSRLYSALCKADRIPQQRSAIYHWLSELDKQRQDDKTGKDYSFFDKF